MVTEPMSAGGAGAAGTVEHTAPASGDAPTVVTTPALAVMYIEEITSPCEAQPTNHVGDPMDIGPLSKDNSNTAQGKHTKVTMAKTQRLNKKSKINKMSKMQI